MMTVVRCRHCNKDSTPVGQSTVDIMVRNTQWCKTCHHSHEAETSFHFCSVSCMLDYLKEHETNVRQAAEILEKQNA